MQVIKIAVYLYSDNNNEVFILTFFIMKLSVNISATVKELANEALTFAKYSNDAEAMEYLNEVLTEMKYKMSSGNFLVFKERINTMLNA